MDSDQYDFRILVIDDNEEIHKDFMKILTKKAKNKLDALEQKLFDSPSRPTETPLLPLFKIDTATQGQDGVDLIKQALQENKPYALAFVDIRMPPGWDGIETIKKIWDIDPNIHVVICSAYSDYSWEETIDELGNNDKFLILKKPFDHIAVRQLAYALTRKWKLLSEARNYTESLEQAVKERTEQLRYLATHDALTGLSNRAMLQDRIQLAISAYKRNQTKFGILFFDIDRFKLINDSLGHSVGDELLSIVAQRLLLSVRALDTIARLGGDEFVLVITELQDKTILQKIAKKTLSLIRKPVTLGNHVIHVTCSMGIAFFPEDGKSAEILLRNADAAMYQAKHVGGDNFYFYSKTMNEKILSELKIESELHQVLANNELSIWYQPQLNIETRRLEAVEALLRWDHPQKGQLLPIDFIPIAERAGLIIPIGYWVLKEACMQNKKWQKQGLNKIRVAVNVTSQQLSQLDFVEKVQKIIEETEIDPQLIELEISESAIINASMVERVKHLKKLGVIIALDDFGTGYSNLHNLRNLSINRLKIDKSFISNIQSNHNDEVIINAIIAMAKSLDLEVLAEGVETQKQLEFLKSIDCNRIQGFYFSKPLPAEDLAILLSNQEAIDNILKYAR